MGFSDEKHNPVGFVLHRVEEVDPGAACKQELLDALASWRQRPNHESPGLETLCFEGCPQFSISYDGHARNYWPSQLDNEISETVVREFLFHDGICKLEDEQAHLFHLRYRVLSAQQNDCLLVCPYLSAAGNISGIVVVLVTRKIREEFLAG